jgi:hypothetical protein
MANPPLETADPPVSQIHTLSVTREIAVVDGRDAQLVLCTITPKDPVGRDPFQAVAKIYDPLYYSFPNKAVPSVPCDVTWVAEQDYSREAAAYEHLEAIGEAGSFAPKYFGSWTFTVDLQMGEATLPQPRSVRLILIEYVPGKSIRELCAGPAPAAATFDEAYRLEVLARILDGNVNLRFKGISQRDLAARNVIIQDPPDAQGQTLEQANTVIPRVVLIDYNISIVSARTRNKFVPFAGTTLPPNPMQFYWRSSFQEFGGWIPAAWENNAIPRQEWLQKRFGGDNLARYAPFPFPLQPNQIPSSALPLNMPSKPTPGNALPVWQQQQPTPPAETTTQAPSPATATAPAPPRRHGRSPLVLKEVAPPPKAVEGEMAVFPVDFWGDAAGKQPL